MSRTPSMETTARLFTGVSSPSRGDASISTMFGPECGIATCTRTVSLVRTLRFSTASPSRRTMMRAVPAANALILDPENDGLGLVDDAEARRRHERDTAVAFFSSGR